VPTANYGVIRHWIRFWENDLLKEPKELVLGSEHLINVLPQAIEPLEEWQARNAGKLLQRSSDKASERRLAGLLERAVVEDPVVDLVAIEHPEEVEELRRLLAAGAYDVSQMIPVLRTLSEAPSSRTLKETVVRELLQGEDADRAVLGAAATVLARRGIGRFTDRLLRDFFGRALASEGTFALIEEHVEELTGREDLEVQARAVFVEELGNATGSPEVNAALDGEVRDLFNVFDDDDNWKHLVYHLLERMKQLWMRALEGRKVSAADGANDAAQLVAALLENEQVQTELGTELIRLYAGTVFRRALQIVESETMDEAEPHVADAGRSLAAFLGERGVFHDPESPGEYDGVLYGTTYRALRALATAIQRDDGGSSEQVRRQ
jgi:hypothetical protein